jgi:hypothetical protein
MSAIPGQQAGMGNGMGAGAAWDGNMGAGSMGAMGQQLATPGVPGGGVPGVPGGGVPGLGGENPMESKKRIFYIRLGVLLLMGIPGIPGAGNSNFNTMESEEALII